MTIAFKVFNGKEEQEKRENSSCNREAAPLRSPEMRGVDLHLELAVCVAKSTTGWKTSLHLGRHQDPVPTVGNSTLGS